MSLIDRLHCSQIRGVKKAAEEFMKDIPDTIKDPMRKATVLSFAAGYLQAFIDGEMTRRERIS